MTRVFPVRGFASDGHAWRLESAGVVTPVRSTTKGDVVVARSGDPLRMLVSVGLLRFNTAGIPDDARIMGVQLQFEITSAGSEDRLRLVVEPYPPEGWPIDSRDFATRPRRSPVGSFELASLHGGDTADLRLLPRTARPRGFTGLRLLVPGPRTEDTNVLHFASFGDNRLPAPRLVVSYRLADEPTQAPHP